MTEFTEQTFGPDAMVDLDGNVFTRCIFDRCRMRYSGGPLPVFNGSSLKSVIWHWSGPAANALSFLSALHNSFGPAGRRDAEEMIARVKSGRHRSS